MQNQYAQASGRYAEAKSRQIEEQEKLSKMQSIRDKMYDKWKPETQKANDVAIGKQQANVENASKEVNKLGNEMNSAQSKMNAFNMISSSVNGTISSL